MTDNKADVCNFLGKNVNDASCIRPFHIRMVKRIINKLFTFQGRIRYHSLGKDREKQLNAHSSVSGGFQAGDEVEIRSIKEIAKTLNNKGKCQGLYFMPEMEKYCGEKYRIFKKVEKIKLETSGELRKLKSPSYFLEGVYCDGRAQGGCDRSCFFLWREAWLKKIK